MWSCRSSYSIARSGLGVATSLFTVCFAFPSIVLALSSQLSSVTSQADTRVGHPIMVWRFQGFWSYTWPSLLMDEVIRCAGLVPIPDDSFGSS